MRSALTLLLILAALALAGWQAQSRATHQQQLVLRSLAARLAPVGALSHAGSSAHFWGSGNIMGLHFIPNEATRAHYGLRSGAALHIPALHYRGWVQGSPWPKAIHLAFDQASLPLAAPWPDTVSGHLDWQHDPATGRLGLAFMLTTAGAARVQGEWSAQLPANTPLQEATLLQGRLHYQDLGLAQEARAGLALRLGADPGNAEAALADALVQWLIQHGLTPDAGLRASLLAFAREPLALTAQFDPPGALRPITLPQFAAADRAAALGLSVHTP